AHHPRGLHADALRRARAALRPDPRARQSRRAHLREPGRAQRGRLGEPLAPADGGDSPAPGRERHLPVGLLDPAGEYHEHRAGRRRGAIAASTAGSPAQGGTAAGRRAAAADFTTGHRHHRARRRPITVFSSVLIANRGEIAARIARTAKRLGLRTVVVYSEADAGALHVRLADEAHLIGPAPAAESYLAAARLIDVAKRARADCIPPGFRVLAE